ncbi:MAG: hypothetical protein EP329_26560 [Deltaproteobacteria bacterium]|nr:MAG: hypothetical protein EP329_26560 [Deltaproteobacteria bacterium]
MTKPLLEPADKARIIDALKERHAAGLRGERITVEAARLGDNPSAAVTLATPDRTFVYTMECAIVREKYTGMSMTDGVDVCFDFLDWYLGEFFESHRELLLPLDWQPHRFGDVEVMARGELRNAFLDDAADAWLRGERPDVEGQWKALKRKH